MTPLEAFTKALYVLGEVFNEPVSEIRAQGYWEALSDLPIDDLLSAMKQSVKAARYFPRPVEIRERIEGRAEDRAELAHTDLRRHTERLGWSVRDGARYPRALPDYLHNVVGRLGGWKSVKGMEPHELRREFMAVWRDEERELEAKEIEGHHNQLEAK